eukprot:TRINITY_DN17463_c0_g2_i2.p1 TRINITY_DN17463_c0_g2~~TRINITY_DN17463_c0_g2_i2.p1  ORF type:complete len:827 (+),score=205.93 TRINITY_DN17463_c0_g2_i2:168-2648(+)
MSHRGTVRNSTTGPRQSKRGDASIRGTKRGTQQSVVGSSHRRGSAADANRPPVIDPDDKTNRTPQPLCAPLPTTGHGGGIGASTMQSVMSMSVAGTGLADGTQLGAQSSFMQSSGPSMGMSMASGSMMAGSMMSGMSGSMVSNASDDRVSTSLQPKLETPLAVDLMKAQQKAECALLTEDDLEKTASIILTETPTVMLLDIKSKWVRPENTEMVTQTEETNTRLAATYEAKVTAADNYTARGVNTLNAILKSKLVQETAPLSVDNGFQVYEFDIYDAFYEKEKPAAEEEEDMANEEEEIATATEGAEVATNSGVVDSDTTIGASTMMPQGSTTAVHDGQTMLQPGMPGFTGTQGAVGVAAQLGMSSLSSAAKIALKDKLQTMERMVMQNVYAAKHLEYCGFDLPAELRVATALEEEQQPASSDEDEDSDEDDDSEEEDEHIDYRLDELWSFECELTEGKNVAALAWSEHDTHRHILAVAYGETDFSRAQQAGAIMLWSLKNPNHPEHIIRTPSGVISLAFSHNHPNLLAAGFYDGTVCVYDIGRRDSKPFLEASYQQKHTGPVWELRWVDQNSERGEKLVSISSDGRVTQWTMKKGLEHTDLFKLKKVVNPAKQKEVKSEAFISRNASGFCFDFSPADPQYYLCGTEEGNVHLCSRSYNHILQTYVGHTGPVYKVKFSPHHAGLFLSASADWSCKMWHVDTGKMLLSYQPNNTPVMDVCWSPAKPTVFGTASADGKLQVYDIAQNQMDPSCTFQLPPNEDGQPKALNALSFGVNSPVVIAGSEDGQVRTFTIHGLSSHQVLGNPKKQLESILMMGEELTSSATEEH